MYDRKGEQIVQSSEYFQFFAQGIECHVIYGRALGDVVVAENGRDSPEAYQKMEIENSLSSVASYV